MALRYRGTGVGFNSGVLEEPGVVASIGLAARGVRLDAGTAVRIFLVPVAREVPVGCRLTHSSQPF